MKQGIFEIAENIPLTPNVYRMTLRGDASAVTAPGQFIQIRLEGLYLRRPLSVYDAEADSIAIIYKIVGRGTEQMSRLAAGETLNVLTGLGNGFDLALSGDHPLLVGGGVGVPPLYLLARRLIAQGKRVSAVLGFNTGKEVFCEDAFRALGASVTVTTADGSHGVKGFVTDALPEHYTHLYACGPLPMLKAVCHRAKTDGQFSFEERMGCGFGACMGCSRKTAAGSKRICREGPVFRKEEILWED